MPGSGHVAEASSARNIPQERVVWNAGIVLKNGNSHTLSAVARQHYHWYMTVTGKLLWCLLAAGALAAGCSPDNSAGPPGTTNEFPTPPVTGSSTPEPPTTAPATSTTTVTTAPVTTSPVTTTPGGLSACRTQQLTVTLGGAQGAAGHQYTPVVFTNTGTEPCSIQGYPGVSYTNGADGAPVGDPATREGGETAAVRLDPGGHATATLQTVTSVDVYPVDQCLPVQVAGLRIYPPNNTESVFIAQARTWCSRGGGMSVKPVAADK